MGSQYAIGFNSATSALQAAVVMGFHDVPKGKGIITTPLTFVSTNHVIVQNGYIPIFADIEPDTGNISVESIRRILDVAGEFVGGIMVVHYAGQPVDIDEVYDLAKRYNIRVIEDASHACGATYHDKPIGSHGDYVCFSFHAVKNLPTGDGGMLATSDPDVQQAGKCLRWLGINKSTADRAKEGKYSWDYDVLAFGFKSHMNDITASIGLGQLPYLDVGNSYRRGLMQMYRDRFDKMRNIKCLTMKPDRMTAGHLMVILTHINLRDKIISELADEGIDTGVHYKPNCFMPLYAQFYRDNDCKFTDFFFKRCISLPLHLYMTEDDVIRVCDIIEKVQGG